MSSSNDDSAFDPNNPFASLGYGAVLTPAAGVITPTATHHFVAAGTISSIATTNINTVGHSLLLLTATGAVVITLGATIVGHTTKMAANDQIMYILVPTSGIWYEVSTCRPAGEWITPTFSAGAFTASGAMTWTVDSGDVNAYTYSLIGKTMVLNFNIGTTSVGGTPNTELRIAVPGGFTVVRQTLVRIVVSDNGAIRSAATAVAPAGLTYIRLYMDDLGFVTNWNASTNTTNVAGQITFEVS